MSRDIRDFLVRKREFSVMQSGAPTPKRARIAASTSIASIQTITIDDDEEKSKRGATYRAASKSTLHFSPFLFYVTTGLISDSFIGSAARAAATTRAAAGRTTHPRAAKAPLRSRGARECAGRSSSAAATLVESNDRRASAAHQA